MPDSACTQITDLLVLEAPLVFGGGVFGLLNNGASGEMRGFQASFKRLVVDLGLLIIARSESNDILRSSN